MDKKFNEACHKALNSIIMAEYLKRADIAEAISPYSAVDNVIAELKEKGFLTGYGFQAYKVTPLGKESANHYMEAIRDELRNMRDRKRIVIQSWISITIAVLSFILSVIAILMNLGVIKL